jgi:hypothetical protein
MYSLLLTDGYSAFNGYFNVWHGNHKYTADDAKNSDLVNLMVQSLNFETDISKLPGIVSIPLCTWAEIKENWKKGIQDDNKDTYPCNNSGG